MTREITKSRTVINENRSVSRPNLPFLLHKHSKFHFPMPKPKTIYGISKLRGSFKEQTEEKSKIRLDQRGLVFERRGQQLSHSPSHNTFNFEAECQPKLSIPSSFLPSRMVGQATDGYPGSAELRFAADWLLLHHINEVPGGCRAEVCFVCAIRDPSGTDICQF
jgi:hypothetical protein